MSGAGIEVMVRQISRHAELSASDRRALADLPFIARAVNAGSDYLRVSSG